MSRLPFTLQFYGVRGSIPAPNRSDSLQRKIKDILLMAEHSDLQDEPSIDNFIQRLPLHLQYNIGANTTCVLIKIGDEKIIIDGGSGCFPMGQEWLRTEFGRGAGKATWLITHTHQDHILGMPMFAPLYIPGNQFDFYSPIPDLRNRFCRFYASEFFPVPFQELASKITFHDICSIPSFTVGDATISWMENDHPGKSYSYRIDFQGKSIVFSTDAEYKYQDNAHFNRATKFFQNADLLIFDAQYAFLESVQEKRNWGHSSSFIGIDFALEAKVKTLALFHHEPSHDDYKLMNTFDRAIRYLHNLDVGDELKVIMAREGLVIEL